MSFENGHLSERQRTLLSRLDCALGEIERNKAQLAALSTKSNAVADLTATPNRPKPGVLTPPPPAASGPIVWGRSPFAPTPGTIRGVPPLKAPGSAALWSPTRPATQPKTPTDVSVYEDAPAALAPDSAMDCDDIADSDSYADSESDELQGFRGFHGVPPSPHDFQKSISAFEASMVGESAAPPPPLPLSTQAVDASGAAVDAIPLETINEDAFRAEVSASRAALRDLNGGTARIVHGLELEEAFLREKVRRLERNGSLQPATLTAIHGLVAEQEREVALRARLQQLRGTLGLLRNRIEARAVGAVGQLGALQGGRILALLAQHRRTGRQPIATPGRAVAVETGSVPSAYYPPGPGPAAAESGEDCVSPVEARDQPVGRPGSDSVPVVVPVQSESDVGRLYAQMAFAGLLRQAEYFSGGAS